MARRQFLFRNDLDRVMTCEIIRRNDSGQQIRTVTQVSVYNVPEVLSLPRQAGIYGDSAVGFASETYNITLLQPNFFYPVFWKRDYQGRVSDFLDFSGFHHEGHDVYPLYEPEEECQIYT